MAVENAWDNHKYVARVPTNSGDKDNKWRYFYSKDAYQAYLKNKNTKTTTSDKTSKQTTKSTGLFSSILNKGRTFVDKITDTADKISDVAKEVIDTGKEVVKNVREHKYVAKEETADGKVRYFYSDKEYQAYLKGKEFVEKNSDEAVSMTPSETFKIYTDNFLALAMYQGLSTTIFNTAAAGFTALKVKMETPESFDELKKIDEPTTNAEDQKVINPEYNPNDYGYSMNCSFCTAAYDLRSRGYDVEANAISYMEAYDAQAIMDWYDGEELQGPHSINHSTTTSKDYAERVEELIKENGEGSRGHFLLYWSNGGGHDVAWEVENGEVVIRDCQLNQEIELSDYIELSSEVSWFRTDNVDVNESVLRTIKNRD